ncbi:LuxR family transcriptional regulator [Micromonospora qiuiae]|uniref:LuxR family transcriptional regulator n=1 Tax=Micromonospora qiuiae TaxID=502268 RepID=A0ABQ4JFD4_9ACTN|nr:LuxR family transcriptional regulator [Micromonospora qiuiae]
MVELYQAPGSAGSLSAVDLDILARLARGATLHQVADELHLSHRTVSRHVQNICRHLGVQRPIEAVVWAVRRDLI